MAHPTQTQLIDGRAFAAQIKSRVKQSIDLILEKGETPPHLAVIQVGDDPASGVYVTNKQHACRKVGIESSIFHLSKETSSDDLSKLIERLNSDKGVHGILLQLPLPKGLKSQKFISAIVPEKDVDGLGPQNIWALMHGIQGIYPCTPKGVLELADSVLPNMRGLRATVVGTSNLVGAPASMLLSRAGMTVNMCNSATQDLQYECEDADLIVCAAGVPRLIKGEWLKEGAVVIDVGITRETDGVDINLVGDFDPDSKQDHLKAITPVPGGVGPMTVANLLANTLQAYELQKS